MALPKNVAAGSSRRIVIAVDFGTTFSGLAWSQTARPDIQTAIIQWPDVISTSLEGMTSDKVPTELRYEGDVCKWGFQIRASQNRFQWFKLELDPIQTRQVSRLAVDYPDTRALPPAYNQDSMLLVTDYLESLRKHAEKVLIHKLGLTVMESTPIDYIVTVPAMWTEAGQENTRRCAELAGMNKYGKVRMISEPEAAAIYALDSMNMDHLKIGDTYVLCDAGGGTVDLISYRVTATRPFLRIEEAAPGTGSLCGSTFLNRIFRKYLETKFRGAHGWDADTLEDAMQRFETSVKRTFTGDASEEIIIPVPGVADFPAKGVRRGKMRMSGAEMCNVFHPVIAEIVSLVNAQIKSTDSRVKGVLLVGGFGQSPYLRQSILHAIEGIEVIQPGNGWTAVVRGALIKGLADIAPTLTRIKTDSRVARKYYGISYNTPFVEGVHPAAKKYWSTRHGNWRVVVMKWFIERGQRYTEDEKLASSWKLGRAVNHGQYRKVSEVIYVCRDVEGIMYPSDTRIRKLATLTADFGSASHLPSFKCSIEMGEDGVNYYSMIYQIRLAFFSGQVEYSLWQNGRRYGSVKAEYD